MKTTIHINTTTEQLNSFEPVEGNFETDAVSDERDLLQIQEAIGAEIKSRFGVEVSVECFRANGHTILDDVPSSGTFLAVRK